MTTSFIVILLSIALVSSTFSHRAKRQFSSGRCPDGSNSIDVCYNTPCLPTNPPQYCYNNQYCCLGQGGGIVPNPNPVVPGSNPCFNGQPFQNPPGFIRACLMTSLCPLGYECTNNVCCPTYPLIPSNKNELLSTMPIVCPSGAAYRNQTTGDYVNCRTTFCPSRYECYTQVIQGMNQYGCCPAQSLQAVTTRDPNLFTTGPPIPTIFVTPPVQCPNGRTPEPLLQCPCTNNFACVEPWKICCPVNSP